MFKILRFFFWLALIIIVIYFSGDIKFRDKSLKTWVSEIWQGGFSNVFDHVDVTVKDKLGRLLQEHKGEGLSDEQLKQIKRIVHEEITDKDRQSMDDLMKNIHQDAKPTQADAKKETQKPTDKKAVPAKKM